GVNQHDRLRWLRHGREPNAGTDIAAVRCLRTGALGQTPGTPVDVQADPQVLQSRHSRVGFGRDILRGAGAHENAVALRIRLDHVPPVLDVAVVATDIPPVASRAGSGAVAAAAEDPGFVEV